MVPSWSVSALDWVTLLVVLFIYNSAWTLGINEHSLSKLLIILSHAVENKSFYVFPAWTCQHDRFYKMRLLVFMVVDDAIDFNVSDERCGYMIAQFELKFDDTCFSHYLIVNMMIVETLENSFRWIEWSQKESNARIVLANSHMLLEYFGHSLRYSRVRPFELNFELYEWFAFEFVNHQKLLCQ